jgi:hypothetical protein
MNHHIHPLLSTTLARSGFAHFIRTFFIEDPQYKEVVAALVDHGGSDVPDALYEWLAHYVRTLEQTTHLEELFIQPVFQTVTHSTHVPAPRVLHRALLGAGIRARSSGNTQLLQKSYSTHLVPLSARARTLNLAESDETRALRHWKNLSIHSAPPTHTATDLVPESGSLPINAFMSYWNERHPSLLHLTASTPIRFLTPYAQFIATTHRSTAALPSTYTELLELALSLDSTHAPLVHSALKELATTHTPLGTILDRYTQLPRELTDAFLLEHYTQALGLLFDSATYIKKDASYFDEASAPTL